MDNPQAQPLPQDPRQRVVKLARDLAQGALDGRWTSVIIVNTMRGIEEWMSAGDYHNDEALDSYLETTWGEHRLTARLLMALGYLSILADRGEGRIDYVITQKAFDLLNQPAAPPSVFISYRRNESSAFGLLLARLKLVGIENPFIDMNIDPGAEWHAHLKHTIRGSKFFVCLLGPQTLDSEYVRKEIEWALDTEGLTIIPIWHNGFQRGENYPQGLETKNAIRVKEESAEEYNVAVIRLLNILGYAP